MVSLFKLQDQPLSRVAVIALLSTYILYTLTNYILTLRRRRILYYSKSCGPITTYPHSDPIFGFDLFFATISYIKTGHLLPALRARFTKLNTQTFSQLILGTTTILTTEPENIKALLATQFKDFQLPVRRKAAGNPIFGHGIFMTDGAEWEESRALLKPNFTRSQVGDLAIYETHVRKVIRKITAANGEVDLQDLFFKLTMDSATEFLFGTSSGVLDGGKTAQRGEEFSAAFDYTVYQMGLQTRMGKLITLLSRKKIAANVQIIHRYVQSFVRKAVEAEKGKSWEKSTGDEEDKYILLEELAKRGVGERKIRDELMNILLAGRDTTASLLSYVFFVLARRKDVLDKLRSEMLTLGDEIPTFEQVKGLKYLSHVLNETLRLYPIVPINGRTAVKDTTLPRGGGADQSSPILVKAGQTVVYHLHSTHRRTDIYGDDAEEFKPERWATIRPGWGFLPFNGGPRICIGQQFALIEASYTIIRLLQAFKEIKPTEQENLMEPLGVLGLTTSVRGGVKVCLTPA